MKVVPILILSLAASFAVAKDDDRNCGDLDNDRARQECRERKYNDVDCGKLDNDHARKECREYKREHDDNDKDVDCGKLDNDALRKACREQKHN